ncbi:MAG: trigger factor [Ilumatobacteraceae bacterium]|nr:MAG: trigger factor [Actinomycetota bacterium]
MKSTIEPLEGNKVKLSVEVDESEFDRDIDAAFRAIAREVRLPGFRAGKAPRKVLEARIGLGAAREQALREAIPQYLAKAVREHDVDLVARPDVEITEGEAEGAVAFDATCEVRPEVTVAGYGGLRVELTSPVPTDEEVQEAVDAERRRHGKLTDVERPAASGDFLTLDLSGTRDGEPVVGLETQDWLYEIGRGWVAAGFDDELTGAGAGDELSFTLTPNGTDDPADFEVTVQSVQELVLADVDDAWVGENIGEFETVEQWTAALRERIAQMKLGRTRNELLERTTDELSKLVDIEPPESMVQSDLQDRVQNTVQRLQAQGIAIDDWLGAMGQDSAGFVESLKADSVKAVKVDLALRAVATAENLDANDDDLDAEFARIAVRVRQKPAQVRKAYERNDAVNDLVAQLRKSKALDWLLHNVELVDADGNELDRDLVLGHDHDDHDHHDHDHDHDHDHHHDHDHDHHDSEPGA